MPRILANDRLLRISQAKSPRVSDWKEGVSIEQASRRTVLELTALVAAHRWQLAFEHRKHANKLMRCSPPLYRCAVSRYYYAMYHALRACAYVFHNGDDHEAHSTLPQHLPADFAVGENWEGKLKDARLIRN